MESCGMASYVVLIADEKAASPGRIIPHQRRYTPGLLCVTWERSTSFSAQDSVTEFSQLSRRGIPYLGTPR
jgi:hypothetical protein